MILTIDSVQVIIPDPLETLSCLLCDSIISFVNKDPTIFLKHLQNQHQVHINQNLIFIMNLVDKKKMSETIASICESTNKSDYETKQSISKLIVHDNLSPTQEDKILENRVSYQHMKVKKEIFEEWDSKEIENNGNSSFETALDDVYNPVTCSSEEIVDNKDANKKIKKLSKVKKKRRINCTFCEKQLFSERSLTIHVKKCPGLENLSEILCSNCGFSTDSLKEYEKHKKVHIDVDIHCEVCNTMFKSDFNLKAHVKQVHERISEICSHCGKFYKNVKYHIKIHHTNQKFNCPECQYTSPLTGSIKIHIEYMHKGELSKVALTKCEECGKEVKNIKRHKQSRCPARKDVQKIKCDQCDKLFGMRDTLKKHIKNIHMNIKDKTCPQCDYKSHSGGNLLMHISRVHEGNSLKTSCQFCNKNVLTHSMDWHIKTYHRNHIEDQTRTQ